MEIDNWIMKDYCINNEIQHLNNNIRFFQNRRQMINSLKNISFDAA